MIIKGFIDQNCKILDVDRLHLDNTEENLDKDLPFINTQEPPLMKSQVFFSDLKSETPLILNNRKELDDLIICEQRS